MPICGIPCSLSLRQINPEVFGSSRLLPQKPYVLLRATLALNSLYWLIRSVRVFGNVHWLVYLTHWTFALQTVYYFLALGSATHLWANSGRKQREEDVSRGRGGRGLSGRRERSKGRKGVGGAVARSSFPSSSLASPSSSSTAALTVGAKGGDAAGDGERTALGCWRKLQWGLLFVCADCSIIVTGVYWTFLYNGWSDQLNLQIHLFNSLFMAVNVFIGASPFRWQHIGIAYIYGTLYLAFDILFYLCGSIFSYDDKVIYFFLDWGKTPGRAITTIAFLMLVALPLAHGFHVLIASGRERLRRMRPDWGWQGTDAEELERVMEVSGMRDADVWAPLTGEGDPNLYDSEEEEMGGASVFFVGGQEEKSRVVGRSGSFGSAALGGGGGEEGGGGRLVGKRALGGGGGVGGGNVSVHKAKIAVL